MTLTPMHRRMALGGLLTATLLAVALVEDDAALSRPEARDRPRASRSSSAAGADRAAVAATTPWFHPPAAPPSLPVDQTVDPFRSKSWHVPLPPPPPSPPTAPTLPFRYLGMLSEDGVTRVFLAHQNRNIIVAVGDEISGVYSVEKIGEANVEFIYKPLGERQVLGFAR